MNAWDKYRQGAPSQTSHRIVGGSSRTGATGGRERYESVAVERSQQVPCIDCGSPVPSWHDGPHAPQFRLCDARGPVSHHYADEVLRDTAPRPMVLNGLRWRIVDCAGRWRLPPETSGGDFVRDPESPR